MTEPHEERAARCAIVLAGGDGKRLSGLTRQITGEAVPKQFCQLIGDTSLLQQTHRRVSLTVDDERIFTTLTRTHERFYAPILGSVACAQPDRPAGEPGNRARHSVFAVAFGRDDSARPGRDFSLRPLHRRRPRSSCAMSRWRSPPRPCGPNSRYCWGSLLNGPNPRYGWIEPGAAIGETPVFLVRRFWEKPAVRSGRRTSGPRLSVEQLRDGGAVVDSAGSVSDSPARTVPGLQQDSTGHRHDIRRKNHRTALRGSSLDRLLGAGSGGASGQPGGPSGAWRRVERPRRAAPRNGYDRPNRNPSSMVSRLGSRRILREKR